MKSKLSYTAILKGCLILGFSVFMFTDHNSISTPILKKKVEFPQFDTSLSPPHAADLASKICNELNLPKSPIFLESVFKINSLRNWMGVFQTDVSNNGLRFEINEIGESALLMPVDESGSVGVIPFKKETLLISTQNKFSALIVVGEMTQVRAQLNGELHTKSFRNVRFGCQKTLSGVGFDASRKLDGYSSTIISRTNLPIKKFFGMSVGINQAISSCLILFVLLSLFIAVTHRSLRN